MSAINQPAVTQPAGAAAPDPRSYSKLVKPKAGNVKGKDGRGYPDFLNSPAQKLVPRADAEEWGWPHYFSAEPCRHGHVSARFTANTGCTDCWLVSKGRPTVYGTAKDRRYYAERKPVTATAGAPVVVAAAAAPLEPDARDQKVLVAVAEHGSLSGAAEALKTTVAAIEGRRAVNPTFAAALKALEDRLGIRPILPPPSDFAWTPEVEHRLIRTWVDTGDIVAARDSCSVTSSQYFQHIEDSPEFSAQVDRAAQLAAKAVREQALSSALRGNPTLLKELLPPAEEEPEKDKRTREEMTDEIIRLIGLCKQHVTGRAALINPADVWPVDMPAAQPDPEPATVADSDDDDHSDLL